MEFSNIEDIHRNLDISTRIYEKYKWLLDCYVLDYFTNNHWSKLQPKWQESLSDLHPNEIVMLLNYEDNRLGKVWPLSILALKRLLSKLSLPRKKIELVEKIPPFMEDHKFLKMFWKNVKAKKRHEISIMSRMCYKTAKETKCSYIVDIGSGLGHLSRMLNYGFNLKVCAIEAQSVLNQQAKTLDDEFEKVIKNYNSNRVVHINKRMETDITVNEFLQIIKSSFNIKENDSFQFGIVGLHPCGDLGPTLLKLYSQCDNARYINIVGCCYMKLTTSSSESGFPLSQFSKNSKYDLSYHSREIACHAIENYIEKLRKGESWRLKIHAYRALIEKIITNLHPDLHHSALTNVKYTEDLTFTKYCKIAVSKLKIDIPDDMTEPEKTDPYLIQWKKVVVFYSLRLLFAPLIETIILLDRLLFLQELGSFCTILPIFNSETSPRNQVLTAVKK